MAVGMVCPWPGMTEGDAGPGPCNLSVLLRAPYIHAKTAEIRMLESFAHFSFCWPCYWGAGTDPGLGCPELGSTSGDSQTLWGY